MAEKFMNLLTTAPVREAQVHYYGTARAPGEAAQTDTLGREEIAFIQARDSFYMATISDSGWPYIQHRGGPPGFLHVLDPRKLAFADFKGNRQLLSTGNLATHDRAALFLMDYPGRTRLKILGHARIEDAREHPELVALLTTPELRRMVERLFFIDVVGFDWNCPQYITPRFTEGEIQAALVPLRQRIAELEAQLQARSSA